MMTPSTAAGLVPRVLSSRFHATTRSPNEQPAKRARLTDPSDSGAFNSCGALWPGTGADGVFRTFPSQQQAFDFWDAQRRHAHLLRTFAVEHDSSGRRSFIVSTPERFWREYRALPHAKRHHYEIIRERCPCHLYFDLEFVPGLNPHLDGNALVKLLVEEVEDALKVLYDAVLHPSMVMEMDSSKPDKWSRHVVVRLPGLAFADNAHVGAFVRLVVLRMLGKARYSTAHARLVVAARGGGATLAVDMGVYTRNRAFRLHLSSKAGKESHLRATMRFGGVARDPREFFFDSLISNTPFGPFPAVRLAQHGQEGDNEPPDHHHHQQQQQQQQQQPGGVVPPAAAPKVVWLPAWRLMESAGGPGDPRHPREGGPIGAATCLRPHPHAAAAAPGHGQRRHSALHHGHHPHPYHHHHHEQQQRRGPCALPGGQRPVSLLRCEGIDWESLLHQLPPDCRAAAALHHSAGAPAGPSEQQRRQHGARGGVWPSGELGEARQPPSPFPDVDAFVESVCAQGGARGRVRSWALSRQSGTLLLSMKDNRWCGNVGRPHRSNGIFYVVDMMAGTWHQRCYDPDCRSYRSECMPLPLDIWSRHRDAVAAMAEQQQQQAATAAREAGAPYAAIAPGHPAAASGAQGSTAGGGSGGGGGDGCVDEDELCLQVLREFELSGGAPAGAAAARVSTVPSPGASGPSEPFWAAPAASVSPPRTPPALWTASPPAWAAAGPGGRGDGAGGSGFGGFCGAAAAAHPCHESAMGMDVDGGDPENEDQACLQVLMQFELRGAPAACGSAA